MILYLFSYSIWLCFSLFYSTNVGFILIDVVSDNIMSVVRDRRRIKLTYNVSFILTDAISYNITPLYFPLFFTPANFIISKILFSPSQRSLVLSLSPFSISLCHLSPRNPNPSLGNDPCTQTLQSLKKWKVTKEMQCP